MKAVILAGGEGSRLRPLTCTVPKPMARIFGKPIIEYIFDMLSGYGVTEAAVTLGYMPHIIEEAYANGYKKLKLGFYREEEPLGTAGSVKAAARGFNEPFYVVSGDAMFDFDLKKIMDYHKASGAKITIVATAKSDPREYGVVKVGKDNRVLGFVEKPSWSQAVSNLANTGIYIVNPECLELIPDGKSYDFAKDLFPLMLERNMPIYCYNTDGYWCDVGNISAYLECHNDIFEKRMSCRLPEIAEGIYSVHSLPHGDYSITPPVYIGKNVQIGSGASIGPYAVIDDNTSIGRSAKIRYSAVLENCCISDNTALTGALVCSGAALKKNARMFENSVAGSGSVVGENSVIRQNVLVWPGKVIGKETVVTDNVKYGNVRADIISDNGVTEECGRRLNAETCVRLGMSIGSLPECKKCGVATDGTRVAKVLKSALTAGIIASGATVYDFGESFEAQMNHGMSLCDCDIGLFIASAQNKEIRICDKNGLPLTRAKERSIENFFAKNEFREAEELEVGEIIDVSDMNRNYKHELLKQTPWALYNVSAFVQSDNKTVADTVSSVLKKLGCNFSEELIFTVDYSGSEVTAVSDGKYYDRNTLVAVCCFDELKKGNNVSVPYSMPDYFDSLSENTAGRVYRYLSAPADVSDYEARVIASKQRFVRDGLFLIVKLLSIMEERSCTLEELAAEIPEKHFVVKTVSIDFSPSYLSALFGADFSESRNMSEGIKLERENGKLLIIPQRRGEAIRILAEADTFEAASELCLSVEEIIKNN